MPGPAPKDPATRARRNATVALTALPAGGRRGGTPRWPLIDDVGLTVERDIRLAKIAELEVLADDPELKPASRARLDQKLAAERTKLAVVERKIALQGDLESTLWRKLWHTPQAAAWEHLGWTRDVATYARMSVLGELGDLKALQEARMWSDRLGLTPMAMLRLRWNVAPDEVDEKRQERAANAAGAPAGRRRQRPSLKLAAE